MTLMTPCPRYKFGGTPDKRAWAPDKRAWACRNVGMGMTKSACVTKTHAHARSCPFALGHARLACRILNSHRGCEGVLSPDTCSSNRGVGAPFVVICAC